MKAKWAHSTTEGGRASNKYSGSPETFQDDAAGTFTSSSFPKGRLDFGAIGPDSGAPQPSAVMINTTDAQGHMTKALAILPAVAAAQGIFRPIDSSNHYATRADVRIDQFGDTDPTGAVEDPNNPGFFLCGCPVGTENPLDWAAEIGFFNMAANPAESPGAGIAASSETHTWHLWAVTANAIADIDLGLMPVEGKWYGVEVDLNAKTGALHGVVTDLATHITLADKTVFLTDPKYGAYDPKVDGVFDTETYMDSELTLVFGNDPNLNKPGLCRVRQYRYGRWASKQCLWPWLRSRWQCRVAGYRRFRPRLTERVVDRYRRRDIEISAEGGHQQRPHPAYGCSTTSATKKVAPVSSQGGARRTIRGYST